MNLAGKTVLITGGRRVGSELARDLASAGARIAMTYHRGREAIEATIRDVEALGAEGIAVRADLSDPDQADRAVAKVVERFGRLDALVNMVSVFERVPFADLRPEHFHAMIAANLTAPYFAAIAASRTMLTNSPEGALKGKIVNMGDVATDRPGRGQLPYLIAKGGLTTMTLALARELAPFVTVNLVQPSTIDPPPGTSAFELDQIAEASPLKRLGTPGDANRLIRFLLEGTDFATGGCYRIDGGRFLGTDDPRD